MVDNIRDRGDAGRDYPYRDADIDPDRDAQPATSEAIQKLVEESNRLQQQLAQLQQQQGTNNGDLAQNREYATQLPSINQTYTPRAGSKRPPDGVQKRNDDDARLYSAMAAVSVLNNQEKEDWERLNRDVFQPWVDEATSKLSIPGLVGVGAGGTLSGLALVKAGASVGARVAMGATGLGLVVLGGMLLWEGYKNGQVSSVEAEDLLRRLGDPHDVKMVGRQLFLLGQILGVKINGKYQPSLPLEPEAITVLESRVNTLVTRLP